MFSVERIAPAPVSAAATEFRVRMRDGVHLATDVYLADDPCAPVVLTRLPYDKNGVYCFIDRIARYFTEHGYHFVAQDVRGKFRSEGETLLFVNEPADGFDTIEWISQQSWCDGNVAMWGDSYFGYTQWAAVSMGHPALKAISPRVTGTQLGYPNLDRSDEATRRVEMRVTYLYPLSRFFANDNFAWTITDWNRPYIDRFEAMQAFVGERSASFDQWYPSPVLLERFRYGHPFDAPAIPVLHTIGWWDNIAPWSWDDHRAIARSHPDWQLNEYLLIESIDHENFTLDAGGTLDDGRSGRSVRSEAEFAELLPRMLGPSVEFFDVFLKGAAPASSIPRVRWNLAHTAGLRTAESWPPPGIRQTSLFPTASGSLAPESEADGTVAHWTFDPNDLIPSLDTNAFAYLQFRPDETKRTEHADVLSFTTPALTQDLDLAGPVTFSASVRSDGPRMDLFAWLIDIDPDGVGTRIVRGNVHVQDAGSLQRVEVDLYEAGYRVRAGHRLQLQLASSDFPEFIPQAGTGEDPLRAAATRINQHSIVLGGDAAAKLTISILEESE